MYENGHMQSDPPQFKPLLERNEHTFISWLTGKFHFQAHLPDYTLTLLHPPTSDVKGHMVSAQQKWIKLARRKGGRHSGCLLAGKGLSLCLRVFNWTFLLASNIQFSNPNSILLTIIIFWDVLHRYRTTPLREQTRGLCLKWGVLYFHGMPQNPH